MSQPVDPRIQARRRAVQVSRSRGSARRLLWILMAVALLATGAWVVQSPALAIKEITVDGAANTPVEALLSDAGVVRGKPLLMVSAVSAEEAVRESPWVSDVAVRKIFPNTIEVIVLERVPVAVLEHRAGDVLVAADGTVVAAVGQVDVRDLGRVLASSEPAAVGESITDPADLAAVGFLSVWQGSVAVVSQIDSELWADVDGYTVRLGGFTEMDQKARSLAAVLLVGQPVGALVNVIAPTRPTVTPPGSGGEAVSPPP